MRASPTRTKRKCAARRRAFNLIEVVAATVILGMLAAGLVLAAGRMRRQEALMLHKRQAVELADRLITAKTTTSGQDGIMAWTVTPLFDPALQGTGLAKYSLRVFEQSGTTLPGAELTAIEFVAQEAELKMAGGRQP